ncbi:hypothetical protein UC8_57630 [Roseimaritima ulvae]|uniref:GxxExxY protein n=2 Tax=Roseimaritima ulvae TaxID=980254 RepID=A0A5B9R0D7_9BACT|nr:hypothetical protein UC8_57630 [Roseimaritima ulvae]
MRNGANKGHKCLTRNSFSKKRRIASSALPWKSLTSLGTASMRKSTKTHSSLSLVSVVDTKTIEQITDHEIGKMLNYLRITGFRVGLLLNFKHAKLEFKRIVR